MSTFHESSNPGNLPSAITSLSGAVCRVCGTRLSPPLVGCPRCEAPHHSDCWEYNGGCSTYGCRENVPATVPVEELPPTKTVSGADLFFEAFDPRSNPAIAAVMLLILIRLMPAPWYGVFVGGGLLSWLVIALRRAASRTRIAQAYAAGHEQARALAQRDEDGVALETKAVTALLGAGFPHALAQAYALFEQQNPRRALEAVEQAALAAELAANGYRVLALEALDKADPTAVPEPPLAVRRDLLLADELAYAVVPAAEDSGAVAPFPMARFRLSAFRSRSLFAAPRLGLASLSPSGWAWEIRNRMLMPGQSDAAAVPDRGWLVAGPFDPARATELVALLWDSGHPTVALTEQELALDSACESVSRAHLSQEEARFTVGGIELVVPWSQVTDVFYGMVVLEDKILDRPEASSAPVGLQVRALPTLAHADRTTYRAVIELHVGEERRRLRIDQPGPEIFRYLGRRLRYIEAENVRLVAKDLVRFAPQARASHGVLGLMMERLMPGGRFEGADRFEEYVRWFVALGKPGVRQRLGLSSSS